MRQKRAKNKRERPHTQAHGRQTAGRPRQHRPGAKAISGPQAGKQRHGMRAHLRETSRTAAGRRHLPAPGAASQTGQTAAEKALHTQSARRANGKLAKRKSGNQTRRQGNNATECGQRKAAEGRHDCGKPHAQPPGGGTSLHPGAASQTVQTAAAKTPHTSARRANRRKSPHNSGRWQGPQAGDKDAERGPICGKAHAQPPELQQGKHAGASGTKVLTAAAARTRTASPAHGTARRAQKNPSEQAKFAFALSPARRGLVNRGRQKIASLFLAGTAFFCCALLICCAQRRTKGGAAPFYPLQAF